jgi:hypothetical protein
MGLKMSEFTIGQQAGFAQAEQIFKKPINKAETRRQTPPERNA